MNFWKGKRVIVTGGAGFLGSALVRRLQKAAADIFVPRSKSLDLRDRAKVGLLFGSEEPDLVFHLAASCGGIYANQKNPGKFFYDNALMGIQVIEGAREYAAKSKKPGFKLVIVGTICAYPKFTPVPFKEEHLWDGYPEETNAPYGLAKKMLLVQAQAYRQQYGLSSIYLLPVNLYGPGDNFDPEDSHVIPGLVRKMVEARRNKSPAVKVWGTGKATRDFLYVEDCAEGLMLAGEKYDGLDPVNLGRGDEISIRDLAELIRKATGYQGKLEWDPSRPDGQPRRSLDTSRARERFGFVARTPFEEGLRATVEWFETHNPAHP